jgi:BirA family biotin operon repressor/biotin-[acetyl-CoA-carboxylase] ligase
MMTDIGRGRLEYDEETLVSDWISRETPAIAWNELQTIGFLRIDSTNREACDAARAGAREGTLIYAEAQTAGRGRIDRAWFSPAGVGIYFSLILRPEWRSDRSWQFWPILTHVAAVALIDALKSLEREMRFPKRLDIDLKWPNDVLLSGKKCAGILLETLVPPASPSPDEEGAAAIVGVGVNVHPGSVPSDLADVATCVDDAAGVAVPRRRLLVGFLKYFQKGYQMFREEKYAEILERWKGFSSMWDGVTVTIFEGERVRDAVTCGLDEIGALRMRFADGAVETVLAGDVRIRRK